MGEQNVKMSERLAVIGVLDPVVVVDTELFTDYIDMQDFEQVLGICMTGNVNNKTFDFTAYGYSSTAGADVTTLKACTQLAAHATTSDNLQLVIGICRQDLVAKGATPTTLRYVRFGILSQAAQDGPVAILAIAGDARYGLAREQDLASVAEIEEDLN